MFFIADSPPPPALYPGSNGSAVLNSDVEIREEEEYVGDLQRKM
jgi:hypothetical protein